VKKRRGYTLAELTISLAVSAVIVAVLITIVISATRYMQGYREDISVRTELERIENAFKSVSEYDSSEYAIKVESRKITVFSAADGEEKLNLSYIAEDKLLKRGESDFFTEAITDITFNSGGQVIKCTVQYGEKIAVYMLAIRAATVESYAESD